MCWQKASDLKTQCSEIELNTNVVVLIVGNTIAAILGVYVYVRDEGRRQTNLAASKQTFS